VRDRDKAIATFRHHPGAVGSGDIALGLGRRLHPRDVIYLRLRLLDRMICVARVLGGSDAAAQSGLSCNCGQQRHPVTSWAVMALQFAQPCLSPWLVGLEARKSVQFCWAS
jgi:hypothetical protein